MLLRASFRRALASLALLLAFAASSTEVMLCDLALDHEDDVLIAAEGGAPDDAGAPRSAPAEHLHACNCTHVVIRPAIVPDVLSTFGDARPSARHPLAALPQSRSILPPVPPPIA